MERTQPFPHFHGQVVEVRIDRTRADAADLHPVMAQLVVQTLGKLQQIRLGSLIDRDGWESHVCRDGAGVEDIATAALFHLLTE